MARDQYDDLFDNDSDYPDEESVHSNSDLDILLDPEPLAHHHLIQHIARHPTPKEINLKHHDKVPGLLLCQTTLSPSLCTLYFNWLQAKYFPTTPAGNTETKEKRINQGMHFGKLIDKTNDPLAYLAHLCTRAMVAIGIKGDWVFDQAIINLYDPGEGIGDHIDLARFDDLVCGLSFGCPAMMRMKVAEDHEKALRYAEDLVDGTSDCVWVNVGVGDLYVLSGEARWKWTHGFPAKISNENNVCARRISVTLRRLKTGN